MATVVHPGLRAGHRVVRCGGQALRRVGAAVPAAARQPQGRGGEGQPRRGAAVLAHPARRRHARAGPAAPGHLVRPARGRPAARGQRTARPPSPRSRRASRCARRRRRRSRRSCRCRARSPRRRWCRSAATATASRPSSPGPPSSSRCRLGAGHLDIATAAGTVIARHALAPAGAGVDGPRPRPRPGPGTGRDDRGQPGRAAPPQAAHPARPRRARRRRRPARSGRQAPPARAGDAVIDLARYAAAAHGRNTLPPDRRTTARSGEPHASSENRHPGHRPRPRRPASTSSSAATSPC